VGTPLAYQQDDQRSAAGSSRSGCPLGIDGAAPAHVGGNADTSDDPRGTLQDPRIRARYEQLSKEEKLILG